MQFKFSLYNLRDAYLSITENSEGRFLEAESACWPRKYRENYLCIICTLRYTSTEHRGCLLHFPHCRKKNEVLKMSWWRWNVSFKWSNVFKINDRYTETFQEKKHSSSKGSNEGAGVGRCTQEMNGDPSTSYWHISLQGEKLIPDSCFNTGVGSHEWHWAVTPVTCWGLSSLDEFRVQPFKSAGQVTVLQNHQ